MILFADSVYPTTAHKQQPLGHRIWEGIFVHVQYIQQAQKYLDKPVSTTTIRYVQNVLALT